MTLAPAERSARVVSRPIPEEPPVTMAILPLKSRPRMTSLAVVEAPKPEPMGVCWVNRRNLLENVLRQGSNARDSSSSPARSSPIILRFAQDLAAVVKSQPGFRSVPTVILRFAQDLATIVKSQPGFRSVPTVILSAAKDLAAHRDRPFAALRVTRGDCINGQVQFVQIEPCLKDIIA